MSKQIAVRLPNDVVDYVDSLVAEGVATSRAAVVARALAHDRRRVIAERDVAILARAQDDDDFDGLAAFSARTPMDDLD